MKNFFVTAALILVAGSTFAASKPADRYYSASSNSTVHAKLGFQSSAPNLGADYETRSNSVGFGGYFFMQTEKEKSGVHQVMAFGAFLPVHLLDDAQVDAYVGPGFGLAMIKGFTGGTDETIIGPSWKVGILYKAASNVEVGLETFEVFNWFNEKVGNQGPVTSLTAAFHF